MSFSGNTYTPPAGATNAAAGQVLQSATWNAIHTDMSSALTLLMTQANTNAPGWQNIMAPNGSFIVWQRGTTFAVGASSTAYTADRWYLTTGANQASTVAAATDLSSGSVPNCAATVTRNSGQTGTGTMTFGYPFDSDEVYRMRGQYISFKCWVKSGANWSPTTGTLTVTAAFGTGAPAKRGAGFTGETVAMTLTSNLTPGAAASTISGTSTVIVPLTAVQGELQFTWAPTGTAGGADSISFDNCCLVLGTIIQDYVDIPFQISLEMCKKHYQKSFPYSVAPNQAAGTSGCVAGISWAGVNLWVCINFSPELRATSSVTFYNPLATASTWNYLYTSVSVTASYDGASFGTSSMMIYTISAPATAGQTIGVHYAADASI